MNKLDKVFFFMLTVLLGMIIRYTGDVSMAVCCFLLTVIIVVNICGTEKDK